jgi:uncharacterized protein (DUF1015 family)
MVHIKPFQAFVYNQEKIKDLAQVVCPPYDVISPARQQHFHDVHPQNFIHAIFGKDIPGEDTYRRAAGYFNDWIKDKILIPDSGPAFYFYWQQFKIRGEKRTRIGFIGLLHLEDKKSSVFAHEHTRLEAKEDRLKLLRRVKANLSPIFVVSPDHKRIIQRTYQKHIRNAKPCIDIVDDEQVAHKVWRLDAPDAVAAMESAMSAENMFIADGHHRYEVACAYREEMRQKLGHLTGEEPFNYVLAYVTSPDPRGLIIFPIHRLVKIDPAPDMPALSAGLKNYFDLEEVRDKTRFFFLLAKAGGTEHVIGMYRDRKYWLLRLKNVKILDKIITDKPAEYRSLDVSILNYLVLRDSLGIDLGDKTRVSFNPHEEELIAQVDSGDAQVAFFLNPVRMQQIISVALAGERMPPKSTYFYPKVLSGLVINKF